MLRRSKTKAPVRNLLTLKPRRKRESETTQTGNEVILVPRFGKHLLGRWLTSRVQKPYHRVTLDEVGTFVWRQFDGRRQVSEIGDAMKGKFGEKVEPVFDRLGQFVAQLDRAGAIEFVCDSETGVVR